MKKLLLYFLAFALVLSLTLTLCACGKSSDDDTNDTPIEGSGNDSTGNDNQGGDVSHEHKYETKTVAATCTKDGYVADYCAECGDEQIVEVLYAVGHNYYDGICAICGETEPTVPHKHN